MKILRVQTILLMLGTVAMAMHMMPETVPVERLVKIAEAAIAREPENAEAHYTLARIHYLAFVGGTDSLEAYLRSSRGPLPVVGPFQKFTTANDGPLSREAAARTLAELKIDERQLENEKIAQRYYQRLGEIVEELERKSWRPPDAPDPKAVAHLTAALDQFQISHRLAPKNSLYRLGYASLLEQARDWAKRHPQAAPESVRTVTAKAVRVEYLKAWEMELAADLKDREKRGMFSPMDMVSYEAGTAFVRLAQAPGSDLSAAEKETLDRVEKSLVQLKDGTMGAVTPIVFVTHAVAGLAELLAPETVVDFPVRGWGPVDRWPWVRPDTAILVWNPSRSGRIVSGAQLFGSYTWELFWKNGYEPLAVLDVDGDGALRGAELDGLAAWRDQNGNGVSESGEVEPLAALGITAFATQNTAEENRTPMNPRGVTFADGRTLPTWDWIVTPRPSPANLLGQRTR